MSSLEAAEGCVGLKRTAKMTGSSMSGKSSAMGPEASTARGRRGQQSKFRMLLASGRNKSQVMATRACNPKDARHGSETGTG
eukprot:3249251-Alexandrium_andersonii.AAC.1